ncbi:kinase-like domain-containing protein [Mycena olivaceomarginata]|nr:kinase-like domain-containing protein [Mycena olivaceomarginata]
MANLLLPTQCLSLTPDTVGLNCSSNFPRKISPGLCAGCEILRNLEGRDLERVQAYPQCVDCGARYRTMKSTAEGKFLCAVCMPISAPASTPTPPLDDHGTDRRAATMQNLHLAQLAAQARRGQAAAPAHNDQFTLVRDPRISVDFCLGGRKGESKSNLLWGLSTSRSTSTIISKRQSYLAFSTRLRRLGAQDMRTNLKHILLSFYNNHMPITGINMSLRDFFTAHQTSPFANTFPPKMKQEAKAMGRYPKFVYFEFHIQQDLFEERTGEEVNISTGSGKRKPTKHVDAEERGAKRTLVAGGIAMRSTFRPPAEYIGAAAAASAAVQPARTKLLIDKASFTYDEQSGDVAIDEASRGRIDAWMHNVSTGRGAMKLVHQLDFVSDTPDANLLVAKHFHRKSLKPDSIVSVTDNHDLITSELMLLERFRWLLAAFFALAKELAVDVDTSLVVSEAWLGVEEISEHDLPCPAAGISVEDSDTLTAARESGFTWLIEPRRSGAVKKYSGTLLGAHFKPVQGRLAATIYVFIHFAWLFSRGSILFCDVQTMKVRDKNVLFDPMAHTPEGNSGPGDHGRKGIKDFITNHVCTTKCPQLGLDDLVGNPGTGDCDEAADD